MYCDEDINCKGYVQTSIPGLGTCEVATTSHHCPCTCPVNATEVGNVGDLTFDGTCGLGFGLQELFV